jgi:hypothetical protein
MYGFANPEYQPAFNELSRHNFSSIAVWNIFLSKSYCGDTASSTNPTIEIGIEPKKCFNLAFSTVSWCLRH